MTKEEKKEQIRQQIMSAANIYSQNLGGRVFLYVYGNSWFEVSFQNECFRHLTGVATGLSKRAFFEKAKNGSLSVGQFGFDSRFPYKTARDKLVCLQILPALTTSLVCVLSNLHTATFTYKLGVTNIDFTIGLSEDVNGEKGWFIPRTLRVKDHDVEDSEDGEFIDFIFSKDSAMDSYSTLTYATNGIELPNTVKGFIDTELLAKFE